jgi:hypothetical protein
MEENDFGAIAIVINNRQINTETQAAVLFDVYIACM